MITFKQFLENKENFSQQDVRQEIFNSPIPDNLKELFKAVNNYNRQSDRNTLFQLMPKYDNMDLPNLDSHGISKISRSFQLNSLIDFLKEGKIPTSMHAHLYSKEEMKASEQEWELEAEQHIEMDCS